VSRRLWGVWYPDTLGMDLNDMPYVEDADDRNDAQAWMQSSGDPTARVVFSDDDGATWLREEAS
jgi:hypothetical protein